MAAATPWVYPPTHTAAATAPYSVKSARLSPSHGSRSHRTATARATKAKDRRNATKVDTSRRARSSRRVIIGIRPGQTAASLDRQVSGDEDRSPPGANDHD